MKKALFLLPLVGLCWLAACKNAPSPSTVIEDLINHKPDTCQLSIADVLPGNRYTDFTAGEKVVLHDSGKNNWRLEVYDLFDCSTKATYQLPPNASADYPYYLADLNYNNSNRKIGVRGHRSLFLIDLEGQKMSEQVTPNFSTANRLADADSGAIQHLEVWENYLVGQTVDWGAFVFRLDSLLPQSITPVAELKDSDTYRSLFLIETGDGFYQAILPDYDLNTGLFSVNPLFDEPKALDPASTVYAGGPYARVKESGGEFVGIDLRTGALLPVIEEKAIDK